MLGESELNGLSRQLSDFTAATKSRQTALDELVSSYGKLLEDYRSLRSDYEEERESREKYKRLVRGQERNPFVLVLVDGDGYIFDDALVKGGAEGGVEAARLLNNVVKDRLSHFGREFDDCRIMVRMYTNLHGLSKALARAGLVGNEARALAPFGANFTRANDLFDFVDAGNQKENADFKIREMFRLFIDNGQCKHIFFAGCHDNGYLSMLTPHKEKTDKITLIRGSYFSPEFKSLGFRVDHFPGVFRAHPLENYNDVRRPPITKGPPGPQQVNTTNGYHDTPFNNGASTPVCTHFLKGQCKFGNSCKKSHASTGDSWRPTAGTSQARFAQSTAHAFAKPTSNFPSPGSGTAPQYPSRSTSVNSFDQFGASVSSLQADSHPHVQPSAVLPRPTPDTENLIPLNKEGKRLDFYLQPPSGEAWAAYAARIKVQKLCNSFQLEGYCKNGADCAYDHSVLTDEVKHLLKTIVHDYPCHQKGDCRLKGCSMGHICYREGCRGAGYKTVCKLNRAMHSMDPVVAQWVPAEDWNTSRSSEVSNNDGVSDGMFNRTNSSASGSETHHAEDATSPTTVSEGYAESNE